MAEKKKFIEVEIPILNEKIKVLGSPEELKSRTIKLDLSRKLRGKGLFMTFRIFIFNEKLVAIPNKMELSKNYIRRILRKRSDYVEDSFKAQCADVSATVKPFLVTRKRVSRAIRKNLRNTAKEVLIEYLKQKDFNEISKELKNGQLQREILPKLKKVYPLSFCDLRVFETKEQDKINLAKAAKKDETFVEELEEETEEETENIDEETENE